MPKIDSATASRTARTRLSAAARRARGSAARRKRLGDAAGLTQFGVNLIDDETAGPGNVRRRVHFGTITSDSVLMFVKYVLERHADAGCSCIATTEVETYASIGRAPARSASGHAGASRQFRPTGSVSRCATADAVMASESRLAWANRALSEQHYSTPSSDDRRLPVPIRPTIRTGSSSRTQRPQLPASDRGTDCPAAFQQPADADRMRSATWTTQNFRFERRRRRRRADLLGHARPLDERADAGVDRGDRRARRPGRRRRRDQRRGHHLRQGRFFRRRRPHDAAGHGRANSRASPRRRAKRRRCASSTTARASCRSSSASSRPAANHSPPRSTASAWAAASSWRSPATIASSPTATRRASACRRSRSACSPAAAARSASRG